MSVASRNLKLKLMLRDFGRRLRAARIAAAYEDATEFAKHLRIEPHTYRKYERGDSMPPLDRLFDIASASASSLDWLLLGRKSKRERKRDT